jgi:hypothetical protein
MNAGSIVTIAPLNTERARMQFTDSGLIRHALRHRRRHTSRG